MKHQLSPSGLIFYRIETQKYSYYLLVSLAIVLLLSVFVGCNDEVKARLGEEFPLHMGENIGITGEELGI